LPVELLARFASGASTEIVRELRSMVHHVELGEAYLAMIREPWFKSQADDELGDKAAACFEHALGDAKKCIGLLSRAAS